MLTGIVEEHGHKTLVCVCLTTAATTRADTRMADRRRWGGVALSCCQCKHSPAGGIMEKSSLSATTAKIHHFKALSEWTLYQSIFFAYCITRGLLLVSGTAFLNKVMYLSLLFLLFDTH